MLPYSTEQAEFNSSALTLLNHLKEKVSQNHPIRSLSLTGGDPDRKNTTLLLNLLGYLQEQCEEGPTRNWLTELIQLASSPTPPINYSTSESTLQIVIPEPDLEDDRVRIRSPDRFSPRIDLSVLSEFSNEQTQRLTVLEEMERLIIEHQQMLDGYSSISFEPKILEDSPILAEYFDSFAIDESYYVPENKSFIFQSHLTCNIHVTKPIVEKALIFYPFGTKEVHHTTQKVKGIIRYSRRLQIEVECLFEEGKIGVLNASSLTGLTIPFFFILENTPLTESEK